MPSFVNESFLWWGLPLVGVPVRGPRFQLFGASFHGVAGPAAESPHRERHRVTFDQPVVEPGRPLRGDLHTKIEIRTGREH